MEVGGPHFFDRPQLVIPSEKCTLRLESGPLSSRTTQFFYNDQTSPHTIDVLDLEDEWAGSDDNNSDLSDSDAMWDPTPPHASVGQGSSKFEDLSDLAGLQALPTRIPLSKSRIGKADRANSDQEDDEPNTEGFVYLIQEEGTAFYKIGMSLEPHLRLQTLQTGNPHTLLLRSKHLVDDMRKMETTLHQRFGAQRLQNNTAREWFEFRHDRATVERAFDTIVRNEG